MWPICIMSLVITFSLTVMSHLHSIVGECFWLDLPLIARVKKDMKALYPVVDYATISIPTYPCGQIGFVMASKNPHSNLRQPQRTFPDAIQQELSYYHPDMHTAAFCLPNFVRKALLW